MILVHVHEGRPCPWGLLRSTQSRVPHPFRATAKNTLQTHQTKTRGSQTPVQAQVATAVQQRKQLTGEKYLLYGSQGSKVSTYDWQSEGLERFAMPERSE